MIMNSRIEDKFKNKITIQNIIGLLLYIATALMIVRSVMLCYSNDIWYDEVFSVEYARHSMEELINLTAQDVHPPLYYIIVHIGMLIGAQLGISDIVAAKIVSVIPFILLFIYSAVFVRKRWGLITGGMFSFMLIAMPQISEYTVEIRMYTWAMLFVTAFCIHAYGIMEKTFADAFNKKILIHGIPLVIYGIAAFYTHYYALMVVFYMYLFMIVWTTASFIRTMKSKNVSVNGTNDKVINFRAPAIVIIGFNLSLVSYVPWISVVASQAQSVSENYWIQEVSFSTLGGIIKFLLKPSFSNDMVNTIIAVILFILLALVTLIYIACYRKKMQADKNANTDKFDDNRSLFLAGKNVSLKREFLFIFFGIGSFVLMLLTAIAASIIIRPVFIYRYMIPAYGMLWLCICIMIYRVMDKGSTNKIYRAVSFILTILIIITGIRNYWAFRGNELYKKVNMNITEEALESISDSYDSENVKIVCNFNQMQALMYFYLEDYDIVLYNSEIEGPYKVLNPDAFSWYEDVESGNYGQISKWLSEGYDVLFIGSFNARDEILENWNSTEGIESEEIGSYLLERYWFNIYKLTLDN